MLGRETFAFLEQTLCMSLDTSRLLFSIIDNVERLQALQLSVFVGGFRTHAQSVSSFSYTVTAQFAAVPPDSHIGITFAYQKGNTGTRSVTGAFSIATETCKVAAVHSTSR